MRKLVVCAGLALLTTACGGETQPAEMPLYQVGDTTSQLVPVPGSAYSDTLPVGPEGKTATVRINWSAARDSANCLRIASLKVDRVGGDPGVIISGVDHRSTGCAAKAGSADTTRFETARIFLEYNTRKGLQSYRFSGPIAIVTGTGDIRK